MDYIELLENLKTRLIYLDLQSVLNLINIINFKEFLNELSDDNVKESYYKLIKLDFKNKRSLYKVIKDINTEEIEIFDLVDQVSLLMDNFTLENEYFVNIINYLLILEDYSINGNDLVIALDDFLNMDKTCLKEFDNNYKILEKIKEER